MLSRSPWKAALLSTNQIPRVIPPGDQQDPKSGETALTPGQERKPHPCSLWPQGAPSSLKVSPAPVATTPQPLPSLPRSQDSASGPFLYFLGNPARKDFLWGSIWRFLQAQAPTRLPALLETLGCPGNRKARASSCLCL